MIKCVVLRSDGTWTIENLPRRGFDKQLRYFIGETLEGRNLGRAGAFMYSNEDAKRDNLPENKIATQLAAMFGPPLIAGDFFRGDVVIVGLPDKEGRDTDVTNELLAALETIT